MGCPPRLSVAADGVAVNFITWYTLISCYTINGGARRCHSVMGGADTPTGQKGVETMVSLMILGAIALYCAKKMISEKWDAQSISSTTSYGERY